MRSLLFVPGSSARMMAKAAASGTDVVIYDLEDAVHPEQKEAARPLVAAALTCPSGPGPLRYVRVNALGTPWCEGDLEAVLPAGPDGIVLPKVTGPEDLDRLDELIGRWEMPAKAKATRIVAVCTETPEATLSLAARSWFGVNITPKVETTASNAPSPNGSASASASLNSTERPSAAARVRARSSNDGT